MLAGLQVDLEEIRNRSRLEALLGAERRRLASAITDALSKKQCDVCTCKCTVYSLSHEEEQVTCLKITKKCRKVNIHRRCVLSSMCVSIILS